ncbi:hypothetical protein [Inhella sp.]|uniref:hypothetical protein n=1 Tax=Inhella sp. TaxID=1921806 RepID=UPI0035AEEB3C
MLGFLLAALAVVASITDSDLLKRMRETGHYNELLQNLFVGALFFLVCTVVSVLALLGVQFTLWFMALFYGLHAAALVVLLIVGWQFWLTLRNLKPSQ